MPRIQIEPLGALVEAAEGQTAMEAADAAGYYWPTTCGGEARCTTCAMEPLEGAEHLSPLGRAERRALLEGRGKAAIAAGIRLGCQARVYGDVVVRKLGVRPPG